MKPDRAEKQDHPAMGKRGTRPPHRAKIVDRITVAADRIEIQLSRQRSPRRCRWRKGQRPISIRRPVDRSEAARAGNGKRLVIENGARMKSTPLVELIKEACAIRNQFLSGSHDSIEQ